MTEKDKKEVEKGKEILDYFKLEARNLKGKTDFKADRGDAIYHAICVTYKSDGIKRIIWCSYDCNIVVFNLRTMKKEKEISYKTTCFFMMFLESLYQIAVTTWDGEVVFFELETLKQVKKIKVGEEFSQIWEILSLNESLFATCCNWGKSLGEVVLVSNFESNLEAEIKVDKIFSNVEGVWGWCQLLTNKKLIALGGGDYPENGGKDYTVKLLDYAEKKVVKTFPLIHTYHITSLTTFICVDTNLERIITGAWDDIIVWSLTGDCLIKKDYDEGYFFCLLHVHDGFFISGGGDLDPKGAKLFTLNFDSSNYENSKVQRVQEYHDSRIFCLFWIDYDIVRGKFVFGSSSRDGTMNIFKLEKEKIPINVRLKMKGDSLLDKMERIGFLLDNVDFSFRVKLREDLEIPLYVFLLLT